MNEELFASGHGKWNEGNEWNDKWNAWLEMREIG
jgi:hypothetical protein